VPSCTGTKTAKPGETEEHMSKKVTIIESDGEKIEIKVGSDEIAHEYEELPFEKGNVAIVMVEDA